MLDVLARAETALPGFLTSLEGWASLDVDYHPPRVERLWRPFEGDYRLYLHRIHPCEDPLYHPHPWPSAITIVSGRQFVRTGYGTDLQNVAEVSAAVLVPGSRYEMVHRFGWHSVQPIGGPSLSLMVTGQPWGKMLLHPESSPDFEVRPAEPLKPLADDGAALLKSFRWFY